MKNYTLSSKGAELYRNTYQTMIDRLHDNGYAATSLTGAYVGMFVRDSSIQAMAHLANGDNEQCERILRYIIGYHKNIGADAAVHIMPEIRDNEIYEDAERIYTAEQKIEMDERLNGSRFTQQTAPLFRISGPDNEITQEFSVPYEEIVSVTIWHQMNCTHGTLIAEIKDALEGAVIAAAAIPATGKKNSTATFLFQQPVSLEPNKTYFLTLKSKDCQFVCCGAPKGNNYKAYNFDRAEYGSYRKTDATIYYMFRPNLQKPKIASDFSETFSEPVFSVNPTDYILFSGTQSISLKMADKIILKAETYLQSTSDQGSFSVTLKKGDVIIGTRNFNTEDIYTKPSVVTLSCGFPLFVIPRDGDYSLEIVSPTPIKWYNHKKVRCFSGSAEPYSRKIQVDGNYMLVNAYAMYALNCFDTASEFIAQTFDFMSGFAKYYLQNTDYKHDNGLLRDPNYEHSRDGRYWDCYNLCTNVFASEALHKMSQLAKKLHKFTEASYFAKAADEIADAVHKLLTCEYEGKTIYSEMIALDEGGKLYKGFSWVNLTPIACNWYAVNQEVMQNTFEAYQQTCHMELFGHDCIMVLCRLNEDGSVASVGNHVIGKGLAWEIYYHYLHGHTQRLDEIMSFIDDLSRDTYPEVWKNDGTISDSANQEQAGWLLYEIALITGKFTEKQGTL